jgi:hypothetical protein
MIPDIESIVRDYLRADPNVSAITTRVVAKTPKTTAEPWVKVDLSDAPQLVGSVPDHLVPFSLQLDCYAGFTGGKPQANDLVRTVRESLTGLSGVQGGAAISGARITGMPHLPDPDLKDSEDHPRERYILDATVYAHS